MTTVLLILGGAIVAFIFARSFFTLIFSMQNHGTHKERMKQLRRDGEEEDDSDDTTAKVVDIVTKPIISYLLPKIKPSAYEELERDLKFAGWDLYFTPHQFRATNLLLKVLGIVALFAFWPMGWFFALIFFGLLFFMFGFLFRNSIKNRQEALFGEFPEFIQIIQGYLMANIPLTKAVEETIPYVNEEWRGFLKDFVLNSNIHSVPEAIDTLCDDVNVFEVREFFSLVKLNLEQGINIKESFESQNEKVKEMQMEVMLNKIGRRQMMAKVVQAPLLLCMFAAAGLPTFYSMMNFTTL